MNLTWDDVRVFLAIARERHLGRAAKRLGLDTSTASRRLSGVEEALGVRLFVRSRDGLVPTPAAERLLPGAEEMERGLFRFTSAARSVEEKIEGHVRVSAPPGIAEAFLAEPLMKLLRDHPGLTIELAATTSVADLGRHEADLAVRAQRPTSGDLVATKLRDAPWAVMVAAARADAPISEWKAERWIGWGEALSRVPAARWIKAQGLRPSFVSDNVAVQVAAVASGFGVALVPEAFAGRAQVARARLAKGLAASAAEWPVTELWMVGHRALREVPRVALVWQCLAGALGARA